MSETDIANDKKVLAIIEYAEAVAAGMDDKQPLIIAATKIQEVIGLNRTQALRLMNIEL